MSEDQPAQTAVKPVSDREFVEMANRCSSEIKMLRSRITTLEPKADAYEKLSAVIDMARPRQGGGMGEDLAWMLDRRVSELAEANPSLVKKWGDA